MPKIPYSLIKTKKLRAYEETTTSREREILAATLFVREIERGNLEADYTQVTGSGESKLGVSLVSMRDQMKKFAEEEKERSWVTEGMARFVEILRGNQELNELSDAIISNLVTYLGANQGALYLLNDDVEDDVKLEMAACYAYGKKKFQQKSIAIGNGLVGQVAIEKQTNYLTVIPSDYIKITSGLGEALPSNVLMVPLIINEDVFGVVELASFTKIKPYQIEFVERLGESIASTIANVRTSDRTKKLLHETQLQAEQMRAQEEEMRQNMEELTATQEEMHRVMTEVQGQEEYLNQLLNASFDPIYTIDRNFRVKSFNSAFASLMKKFGAEAAKGVDTRDWYEGEKRDAQVERYAKVMRGERVEVTDEIDLGESSFHLLTTYSPLRDKDGNIFGIAVFLKDITGLAKAKHETEKSLVALREKDTYVNNLLNGTVDAILSVDKDLHVVMANDVMVKTFATQGIHVQQGFHVTELSPKGQEVEFVKPYQKALSGEIVSINREYFGHHYLITYNPLRNSDGSIIGVGLFTKDVTEQVELQRKTEALLREAQQQAEELKAQEEEMRQNMEELTATQEEMNRILAEVQRQEQYLGSLLNANTDSIFTIDRDYKLISYNNAFVIGIESMGVEVSPGYDIFNLFPDSERDDHKKLYDRAFAGEIFEVLESVPGPGKRSHYSVAYAPLRDVEGKIYGVAAYANDITRLYNDKENAETMVTEAKLREEAFGLTNMLAELDANGSVLTANSKLCKVSGYEMESIIGRSYEDFVHDEMPTQLIEMAKESLGQGKVVNAIVKNRGIGKIEFWTDMTILPVRDKEGNTYKYVVTMYHITSEEMANYMFEKQRVKLSGK